MVSSLSNREARINGKHPLPVTDSEALTPTGGRVAVTVIDHGPGIAADQRERVFERFVQLDQSATRAQGGTGLGLYLCRRLTELLDTSLTLTETPGGGCTFTLELTAPMNEDSMMLAQPKAEDRVPADVPS